MLFLSALEKCWKNLMYNRKTRKLLNTYKFFFSVSKKFKTIIENPKKITFHQKGKIINFIFIAAGFPSTFFILNFSVQIYIIFLKKKISCNYSLKCNNFSFSIFWWFFRNFSFLSLQLLMEVFVFVWSVYRVGFL